jgi:hypothetical protein
MLNKSKIRELAYVTKIDSVTPIEGYDRVELVHIGGWTVVVGKGDFKAGDPAIYFEIDSKLPEVKPFTDMEFLAKKHYKIKTQKMCKSVSQGFVVSANVLGWTTCKKTDAVGVVDDKGKIHWSNDESRFLTEQLGVTYATVEDNKRKGKVGKNERLNSALARHPKIAKKYGKVIKKNKILKALFLAIFGHSKAENAKAFPKKFPHIHVTDQERCENMTWVLEDKTPYIVTQKCDGSSGTYILERKPFGRFEFYVCSRRVRQLTPKQDCFHDENYYWECAIKYDIKNKLKDYLQKHPQLSYVCWQGEVCAPSIQKNPHGLTETHFYCFHMIDSEQGKYDIRDAAKIWKDYNMEIVPIVNENYILPDDFEEFKKSAEGYYDASVCEGKSKQRREGFVYYKTTDPNFSFKNVSREYLLKH